MSETIKLQNAGPVENLTIPIQDGGRITIIKGMNDSGKSESLKALSRLAGGNEKISKRHGSPRGFVEGFGARLDLLANVRASGKCEAVSLSGKLDIGDLITGQGLKDPVAADRKRIAALLTVRGVKADLAKFLPLVGDDEHWLGDLASDATQAATDLVDMAARLKNDFERKSRSIGDDAKAANASARAERKVADGVDMDAVSDSEILQAKLEAALKNETTTINTRVAQVAAIARREMAKRKLAEAEESYDGPTFAEATATVQESVDDWNLASGIVAKLLKKVETAKVEESRLATAHEIAVEKQTAARQHEDAMAGWAETIESDADVEQVSKDDTSKAAEAVQKARNASENGVRIRDAKKALAEADDCQGDADTLQKQADQLRDAAKGTNDVLADAVDEGALIPVTDDNGHFRFAVKSENGDDRRTYFHDLGPGRRTAIAVIEAASCLRALDPELLKVALVVLPQPMWEGLDWEQRKLVWECVKRLEIHLVSGECDKDPADTGGIRAEVFEPAVEEVA